MVNVTDNPIRRPGVEVFEQGASRYDTWFEKARGRAIFASEVRCLRRLSADLPRPWIEVGVGTGRFAEALGIDVGVDPAIAPLQYAQDRGITAAAALGQALPFADRQFGAVFVIVTICFADDPSGLLAEARRVVKGDGGVVLGIVPAGSAWARLYASKGMSGHPFYSEATFFSRGDLVSLAGSAGLRFQRSASTLFQPPTRQTFEVEDPRDEACEEAGFVSVLLRPQEQASTIASL